MSNMRSLKIVVILLAGFAFSRGQPAIRAAFWNVENLFDTTNSAYTRDDDFTPSGRYHWTAAQLQKKYADLSHVINDIAEEGSLALLGLAEIENHEVLAVLNDEFIQSGYEIIHKESPDERGIDCALLYDPASLILRQRHFLPIFLAGDEKTRDIIEAEFELSGSQHNHALYVFVNHWPSRWGGQQKTDPLRRATALVLRNRIDEILIKDPAADILIMGDFNDYPGDPSLRKVLRAGPMKPVIYPGDLINTTWKINLDPDAGTCMFDGNWVTLDQIIISTGLRDNRGFSWVPNSTVPFRPDYLIESDGEYAGWPFRMHRHGKYNGGYSDHLPVICQLIYSDN